MSDNLKKRYRKFDEYVAELESDPDTKAKLDKARKWVKETFYPTENKDEQQDSRID